MCEDSSSEKDEMKYLYPTPTVIPNDSTSGSENSRKLSLDHFFSFQRTSCNLSSTQEQYNVIILGLVIGVSIGAVLLICVVIVVVIFILVRRYYARRSVPFCIDVLRRYRSFFSILLFSKNIFSPSI